MRDFANTMQKIALITMLLVAFGTWQTLQGQSTVEMSLNGLNIKLDANSGTMVEMSYPGVGAIISTSPERASMIDLAYPVEVFEPLRLAPRFSNHAQISRTSDCISIHWSNLGASRQWSAQSAVLDVVALKYNEKAACFDWVKQKDSPYKLNGRVAATVTITAAPDNQSILMECQVDNQSDHAIPQVLFPDLMGISQFQGEGKTQFRTCGFVINPFELLHTEPRGIKFYGEDISRTGVEFASGEYYPQTPMLAGWMDIGGLNGGMSLFKEWWLWGTGKNWQDARERVWLKMSEDENKLRLACMHRVDIKPGQIWKSSRYVLTPHKYGWAKGIEPFRAFVKANLKRPFPLPRHVLEGIGFRTLWMTQAYPNDPNGDCTYRAVDLPRMALEAREHGINEMCLWSWSSGMQIPITPPFPQIGTTAELHRAILRCRELGVNVGMFISLMSIANPTAQRWGLSVAPPEAGWTYHSEFIPVMRPYYGSGLSIAKIDSMDQRWYTGVYDSCQRLIDTISPSIGWDQWDLFSRDDKDNQPTKKRFYELTEHIRQISRNIDPESTLSGECIDNMDANAIYLDYSWNWNTWPWVSGGDCRPFNSVYPAPRLNINIDRSAREACGAFIDNHYLNVFTSARAGINGSGRIADYPELSQTLKQLAHLKKQFLSYFLKGTLIGDCILSEESPGLRVSAYILPNKLLVLAMNDNLTTRTVAFRSNLAPWLSSETGKFLAKGYDIDGRAIGTSTTGYDWRLSPMQLPGSGIVIYEVMDIRYGSD